MCGHWIYITIIRPMLTHGAGVGIYFSGLIEDKSISLSSEATVFQAEIHAIRQSIICLKHWSQQMSGYTYAQIVKQRLGH